MKDALSVHVAPQASLLATEHGRQHLVTVTRRIAQGTRLMLKAYERTLLDQFVRGNLTLDEVITRLEAREPE